MKDGFALLRLAGEPGFEPRQADPESAVLPLHYSPAVKFGVRSSELGEKYYYSELMPTL